MCAAGLGIAPPLRRNPQGRRGPYALTLTLSGGEGRRMGSPDAKASG